MVCRRQLALQDKLLSRCIFNNYACCQALVNNNFYTKKQLYWKITVQEYAYKSQHKIILVDLNGYMAKHCLIISQ